MKGTINFQTPSSGKLLPCLCLLVLTLAQAAAGQAPASSAPDPETAQRRIMRARALAAAGNLPAARGELESLRAAAAADESVREITLVLLMGIYFEQSDYAYAETLLTEAFRARSAGNEAATRGYYLLAGQVLGGVRSQLDRYREFGLDTADAALPDEATSHLDRLRKLVERVVAHGRALRDENARSIDAAALLENASSARVLLARSEGERAQWQREVADVRQRLAGSNARTQAALASNAAGAAPPAATRAVPQPTPAAPATVVPTPAPAAQPAGSAASPAATGPAATSTGAGGAAATVPAEVGSLISRASQTVAPAYPTTARAARVSGRVTVFLLIDEKGAVEAVRRTEGPELLRRAAEDAARRWKFRQTVVDNKPVRVSGFISFNFAL